MLLTTSILQFVLLSLTTKLSRGANNNNQQKNEGEGIKCYVCNSARDPRCGDPFSSETIELVDCKQFMPDKNTTVCRKNVQKVSLAGRYDMRVVRTCGYESDVKPNSDDLAAAAKYDDQEEEDENDEENKKKQAKGRCFTRAGTFEVMVTYCSCNEPGCNQGNNLFHNNYYYYYLFFIVYFFV